ncbi:MULTISPECIES: hypothetical protein [Streptomyces]|nr:MULTISPECIES: hypothetical protein [Streptomyces]
MARSGYAHERLRGSAAAAMWAVLLTVVVTLLGSSTLSGGHSLTGGDPVSAAAGQHREPHADDADPAVASAAIRNQGDATAERHAPLASVQSAPPGAQGGFRPARPPCTADGPPVPQHQAHHHGVRAPPATSGI